MVVGFYRTVIVSIMFLWCGMSSVMAAEVIAAVDRAELVEGETVTLVLQTNDPEQNLTADLSQLQKDFEILDQRSETQMSIVNGRQEATVRLLLTLEPKRSGQLQIPAFSLPGATTRPIALTVSKAPELEPGEMPPVFIELAVDPDQGPYYVHAQLALTVRIFYQQNLTEAAINPPSPQQASVRLLDEVPFQSTRNGVRYRVLERRYAIFPERSGELEIPPLQLSGRLIERPADRLWQPSVRGRRVSVDSDPIIIEVLPKPADYSGEHWLPARRMTFSQQISDADELRVGEPVTRTVILDAVGLEENMIEEPAWPELQNARIYPDQPQGISRDNGQWVLGHKEFRYAVVPEQPGELVLPEIRLDWWDTTSNQPRTAILPEHRVEVLDSGVALDLASQQAAATGIVFQGQPGFDPALESDVKMWRMLAMLFAGLWLITSFFMFRGGLKSRPESNGRTQIQIDEQQLLSDMKSACQENDAARVRNLLGRWLRRYGPRQAHGSVMEFTRVIAEPDLAKAIKDFDAGEFGTQAGSSWSGAEFWKAFAAWQRSSQKPVHDPDLEPDLYAKV